MLRGRDELVPHGIASQNPTTVQAHPTMLAGSECGGMLYLMGRLRGSTGEDTYW